MASERDPSIGKTTLFQDPGEFWLCQSKEKYGQLDVVVSIQPAKTYQVLMAIKRFFPFVIDALIQ